MTKRSGRKEAAVWLGNLAILGGLRIEVRCSNVSPQALPGDQANQHVSQREPRGGLATRQMARSTLGMHLARDNFFML